MKEESALEGLTLFVTFFATLHFGGVLFACFFLSSSLYLLFYFLAWHRNDMVTSNLSPHQKNFGTELFSLNLNRREIWTPMRSSQPLLVKDLSEGDGA